MSDQNSHSNPWNEKLQHLSVPDVNDTWNSMQTLLDKEMPMRRNNGNLKWLLLLLLLLLVIGVCNCPGLRENKFSGKDVTVPSVKDSLQKKGTVNKTLQRTNPAINEIDNREVPGPGLPDKMNSSSNKTNKVTKQVIDTGNLTRANSNPSLEETPYPGSYPTKKTRLKASAQTNGRSNLRTTSTDKRRPDKTTVKKPGDEIPVPLSTNNLSRKGQEEKSVTKDIDSASSVVTDTATIKPGYQVTDTVNTIKRDTSTDSSKKPDSGFVKISPADSTRKEKNRGFVVALGFNQFFAIGGQKPSSYNSSGTTGVLADYIPVPQVRYHFNKKFYVQVEAQFNAPQYTRQILASQYLGDSIPLRPRIQHSVYIKKLFYFNLPFSLHYSPAKNFQLGAGLQFSQLKNGVGLFEDRRQNSSIADTGNVSKFKSLKSDSTYDLLKTNEWRFLADANYKWKGFTFGLRYNQAFNYFINVRISNTQITQARNNSLQLYLRYDIWDGRKR